MATGDQEIEVKFYLRSLPALADRLQALGARLVSKRVFELNLRFDLPDGDLARAHQVLRLRRDEHAVMTYKGPSQGGKSAAVRQEVEFQVSNFDSARRLLEALGYQVSVIYEKYRATYELGDVLVTLDELPYGSFAEVKSSGGGAGAMTPAGDADSAVSSLRTAAAALRLDWEARITSSYLALFDHLRLSRGLSVDNLTFNEMQGISVEPADLGLRYADQGNL